MYFTFSISLRRFYYISAYIFFLRLITCTGSLLNFYHQYQSGSLLRLVILLFFHTLYIVSFLHALFLSWGFQIVWSSFFVVLSMVTNPYHACLVFCSCHRNQDSCLLRVFVYPVSPHNHAEQLLVFVIAVIEFFERKKKMYRRNHS